MYPKKMKILIADYSQAIMSVDLRNELEKYRIELESRYEEIKRLNEEIRKLKLSITNSNTAKNGYKEESNLCDYLNNNPEAKEKCGFDSSYIFSKIKGVGKVDIASENYEVTGQVKSYKSKQSSQQLGRCWTSSLTEFIPELKEIEYMLKGLCELPLKDNGKIDSSIDKKTITLDNYTNEEIQNFINVLNANRKQILEYAFYGTREIRPEYLFTVYCGEEKKIRVYKINDIIDYLSRYDFKLGNRKTTIKLNHFSIQRKGGDGGNKSSNNIQFKINSEKLEKIEHVEL